jgi:hypothetical protein
MTARTIAWILPALLLAACGGESQPEKPRQQIVVRSDEQNQLHQLNDLNRAIALKRAIYASGYTCRRVESSGFVQKVENLDMWTAKCADGREWAIFAGPDGSAQVRYCADLPRFGMPECVIREKAEETAQNASANAT